MFEIHVKPNKLFIKSPLTYFMPNSYSRKSTFQTLCTVMPQISCFRIFAGRNVLFPREIKCRILNLSSNSSSIQFHALQEFFYLTPLFTPLNFIVGSAYKIFYQVILFKINFLYFQQKITYFPEGRFSRGSVMPYIYLQDVGFRFHLKLKI